MTALNNFFARDCLNDEAIGAFKKISFDHKFSFYKNIRCFLITLEGFTFINEWEKKISKAEMLEISILHNNNKVGKYILHLFKVINVSIELDSYTITFLGNSNEDGLWEQLPMWERYICSGNKPNWREMNYNQKNAWLDVLRINNIAAVKGNRIFENNHITNYSIDGESIVDLPSFYLSFADNLKKTFGYVGQNLDEFSEFLESQQPKKIILVWNNSELSKNYLDNYSYLMQSAYRLTTHLHNADESCTYEWLENIEEWFSEKRDPFYEILDVFESLGISYKLN